MVDKYNIFKISLMLLLLLVSLSASVLADDDELFIVYGGSDDNLFIVDSVNFGVGSYDIFEVTGVSSGGYTVYDREDEILHVVGDGICDSANNETSENSPEDCKQTLTDKTWWIVGLLLLALIWSVYSSKKNRWKNEVLLT